MTIEDEILPEVAELKEATATGLKKHVQAPVFIQA